MASPVGPIDIPLAAGSAGERIADPSIDALLSYLGFWLKDSLDARLANLVGTSSDACPTANRFAFNPTNPRANHVRLPVPALFIWWDGGSKIERLTSLYDYRYRELQALYVCPELPQTAEMVRREGMMSVVDAAFHKAAERQRHPSFSYGGGPSGDMLPTAVASLELMSFEYQGGKPGRFGIDQHETGTRKDKSGRDYPALYGVFTVRERIEQDTPEELAGDVEAIISAAEGGDEVVEIMTRYLPGPDGSEQDE